MKMKRQIISWGMMLAAAFTLTNCAKEIDAPVQEVETGYPFEIVASTVDTKTVNDGMTTLWAEGDKINLFHALGDDTNYVNDGAFTVADVEAGVFTGTIKDELDVEEEYDWFALYPYSEQVTTPAATTAGYTYIGHSKGLNQTGYNSTASLKGSICPLYGVLKYGGVKPVIEMNHLTSVLAINVTNDTDEPLTITTASFTAPEEIVGSFYIDFTDKDNVVYNASQGYTQKTAVVNVTEGTALENGESAILYLAIKPFTAAAGEKLTLAVNGYSKEITLAKDAVFTAGKIKTVNFSYDATEAPAGPAAITVAEFLKLAVGTTEYQLTGVIEGTYNTTYGNFYLNDGTGKVLVYGLTKTKVSSNDKSFASLGLRDGDTLTLIGQRSDYNGTAQVGGPAYYVSHVAAPFVGFDSASATVVAEATTYSIAVKSNADWTAVATEGVALDKTSGNGNATVVMTFAANESEDPIIHVVTFACGDSSAEFTLTQKGVAPAGEVIVFEESFSASTGTMGWDGTHGNGTFKSDNTGWTVENAYGAGGSAKFGTSSKKGKATTPALNITGTATLKFKAGAWNNGSEATTLNLSMTGGTLSVSSVTLKKGAWTEYEVIITGASSGAKITFEAKNASKNRFFLDDIQIIQ